MVARIPYGGSEIEAVLEGERWTVRLGELEESSLYLDFALATLLDDNAPSIHAIAAQIVELVLEQTRTPPAQQDSAAAAV